jgi:hypothetical protein
VDIDTDLSEQGFKVYDFATADSASFELDSFRPRYMSDVTRNDTVDPPQLCGDLSYGSPTQVYFPIRRLSSALR